MPKEQFTEGFKNILLMVQVTAKIRVFTLIKWQMIQVVKLKACSMFIYIYIYIEREREREELYIMNWITTTTKSSMHSVCHTEIGQLFRPF